MFQAEHKKKLLSSCDTALVIQVPRVSENVGLSVSTRKLRDFSFV